MAPVVNPFRAPKWRLPSDLVANIRKAVFMRFTFLQPNIAWCPVQSIQEPQRIRLLPVSVPIRDIHTGCSWLIRTHSAARISFEIISSNHHQLLPATWLWIWLQSRSYACPRCETPHRLQLKFHLEMVARYEVEFELTAYLKHRMIRVWQKNGEKIRIQSNFEWTVFDLSMSNLYHFLVKL